MILNKMRPSIFLPVVMCCWAVVSASTGAVQNYTGAVVLRFLLGFVEAPFFRKIRSIDSSNMILTFCQPVLSTCSAPGTQRKSLRYASQSSMQLVRWQELLVDCWEAQSWVE